MFSRVFLRVDVWRAWVVLVARLRLLAISDVHGKEDIVERFLEWFSKENLGFDVVVFAGDIGNPQRPGSMCRILSSVAEKLGKPVYYVKGNWDIEEGCNVEKVFDLETTGPKYFGDIVIVGHGRNSSPFELKKNYKQVVLVTHYPPYSIMDKGKLIDNYHQSMHAGLMEINYLIAWYSPRVHIFGHSHSYGGIDIEHNGVIYVNVARLDRTMRDGTPIGNYAIIDINSEGDVHVEWRFINGVWKKCQGCGRIVHIPEKWSLCRKCAHRSELRFGRIANAKERLTITFKNPFDGRIVYRKIVTIPYTTLKDQMAYDDFVDMIISREAKKFVKSDKFRAIELTKDKIIEFYDMSEGRQMTPFSEYLFACDERQSGRRLCVLMKAFSADKRVHVMWRIRDSDSSLGNYEILNEYVFLRENIVKNNHGMLNALRNVGFTPIVYNLE
ncbi:MAG: hypothetical protein DRJ35_02425 [Thermoprotei archaeon]|nr:MAG: hypothetical protein DRJ35_02425 [Thermoprotei archaeon]